MTRRVRRTTIEEPIETPAPAAAEEASQPQIELIDASSQAIDALLADFAESQSITITAYKNRGKGERMQYVFKCGPEEFSFDRLRDEGGGDFRLFIVVDNTLRKRVDVSVMPPKAQPAGAQPAALNGSDVAAVLREGFAQQAQLLRDAVRAPAPAIDIPALITAATSAIAALSQIAKAPPAPAPAPAADPGATVEKMLSIMQKGIELGQSLSGSGEEGFTGIVRDLIRSPIVGEGVKAALTAGAQTIVARQAQQPQPQIAAAPAAPAAPVQRAQPDPNMIVYHYVHQLVLLAADDSPVETYAEVILDRVPEGTIRELIGREDWYDNLCRIDPAAVNHREWFTRLRESLIEALTQPAGGEESPSLTGAEASGIGAQDASGSTPADAPE